MGPAGQQQVGWFGRTLGWANTRDAWLARLGVVAWLAGLWLIVSRTGRMTTGEAGLAVLAWLLVLAVAARHAVRDMFGPVFFYEVIRVGRRVMTFRLRFLYVAALSGLLVLMYVVWLEEIGYFKPSRRVDLIQTQELSKFANQFFEVFVVVQYLTVMLLTPVYVGGTIAVEKERKTLEFLLATDLRNREIVFGKLAARVTNLLMFVFAGLPIVAVLQLFGGIDPNLLLAAFAATVINIIGLSAVAVWLSAILRRARDAIVLTYMLALVYVFGSLMLAALAIAPPFAGAWWTVPVTAFGYSLAASDVMTASAGGNPLWMVVRLQGGPPGMRANVTDLFREFATFWGLVTVVAIGLAVWRLRAVALHQSYGGVKQPRKRTTAGGRPVRRNPEVGDNPVFWREVFVEGGVKGGWLWRVISGIVVVLIFVPVVMILYENFFAASTWRAGFSLAETWDFFTREINAWARGVSCILVTLMLFAAAVRGAGAISGEKDKDTWVSLLSAPLSADTILWGKWWGCVLGLRRAYAVLLFIWCLGLGIGAIHPAAVVLVLVTVFVLVSAFSWVGLFCSMRAKNSLNASIQAFFATAFLVGGFWALLGMFCGLPLSILDVKGQVIDDLVQIAVGFTPAAMPGFGLYRSFEKRDMRPMDFEMEDGLGFFSLLLGLLLWVGVNVLFASVCLAKFRQVTNRVPAYLPEEQRVKPEKAAVAKPARAVARPLGANGSPAAGDAPTIDERALSARDRPPGERPA
jgi:ABC-type transport system involved in multi-copper enzyme maturation permease subunit